MVSILAVAGGRSLPAFNQVAQVIPTRNVKSERKDGFILTDLGF
jgi:hypothetical protein